MKLSRILLSSRLAMAAPLAAALLLAGCSQTKWSAEGTIAGASGKDIVIEAPNAAGNWYPLDTVTADKTARSRSPASRSATPNCCVSPSAGSRPTSPSTQSRR